MDNQKQNLRFEFGSSKSRALIYFGISVLIISLIILIAPGTAELIGIKYNTDIVTYMIGAVFAAGIIIYIKTKKADKGFILEIKNGYAEFRNKKDMSLRCALPINELEIKLFHNGDLEDTAEAPYYGPEIKFENPGISDITILTRAKYYKWKNAKNKLILRGFSSHELDPAEWILLIDALGLKNELIVQNSKISKTGK